MRIPKHEKGSYKEKNTQGTQEDLKKKKKKGTL